MHAWHRDRDMSIRSLFFNAIGLCHTSASIPPYVGFAAHLCFCLEQIFPNLLLLEEEEKENQRSFQVSLVSLSLFSVFALFQPNDSVQG
jgi:hypothetical protein